MKLRKLHTFDFRWMVAHLPAALILAGIGTTPLSPRDSSLTPADGSRYKEVYSGIRTGGSCPFDSGSTTGIAGDNQPATVPDARWVVSTFFFGKDQSRKQRALSGLSHSREEGARLLARSLLVGSSLGSVSTRLGQRFSLLGLKPSGTS